VVFPVLRKGSRGEYVTLLQTKLIQRGYDLSPYGADGVFGGKTLEAVKRFQSDNGLISDGAVGAKTWDALNSGETPMFTVTITHISKAVAEDIISTYGGQMVAERG
jgi:peptidoglycan hydrolase-like protein with peptidoglycan-binding domain